MAKPGGGFREPGSPYQTCVIVVFFTLYLFDTEILTLRRLNITIQLVDVFKEMPLHFAGKLNSWHVQKCYCFGVLAHGLLPSTCKAALPDRHSQKHMLVSAFSVDMVTTWPITLFFLTLHGKGPRKMTLNQDYNMQPRLGGGESGGEVICCKNSFNSVF